jgi:uncharacterized SAM-binding protein YcdF (DUF218 family)
MPPDISPREAVSGVTMGTLDPGSPIPPVSLLMRAFLVHLGVSAVDVVIEDRSRTNYESAVETRRILERRKVRGVLLVTEAVHMLRSLHCFCKQGVEAVPAACHHRATQFRCTLGTFLPRTLRRTVRRSSTSGSAWPGTG